MVRRLDGASNLHVKMAQIIGAWLDLDANGATWGSGSVVKLEGLCLRFLGQAAILSDETFREVRGGHFEQVYLSAEIIPRMAEVVVHMVPDARCWVLGAWS